MCNTSRTKLHFNPASLVAHCRISATVVVRRPFSPALIVEGVSTSRKYATHHLCVLYIMYWNVRLSHFCSWISKLDITWRWRPESHSIFSTVSCLSRVIAIKGGLVEHMKPRLGFNFQVHWLSLITFAVVHVMGFACNLVIKPQVIRKI